jgi:hypothetical protein
MTAPAVALILGASTPSFAQVLWKVLWYPIDNQTAHEIRVDFCSARYQNRCWPSVNLVANRFARRFGHRARLRHLRSNDATSLRQGHFDRQLAT